jgi:hypothetical protein
MQALTITHSSLGRKLKAPVVLSIPDPSCAADQKLQEYIITSLSRDMPSLISLVFENKSLIQLAKHLLRHRTGSPDTLREYVYNIARFCKWLNSTPDQIVQSCLDEDGDPLPKAVSKYNKLLDDYVGELQAADLAPGTVNGHVKGAKSLFRCNGLRLESPFGLSNRRRYKDRAPKPEELAKLIDIADIRQKVIISLLALGGFREGTLVKLKYRHVKHDLEEGTYPIHVHVESEITKGKYHDYDTFLGQEIAEYLKVYLQARRNGTDKIPPEIIHDDSPLIRHSRARNPLPVSTTQVYIVLHKLYLKAGLIPQKSLGRRYDLCAHSIRKYFKTTLASLNVQPDYIEYMMGHTVNTYHDIEMKGIEYLRGIYASSGLGIKRKTRISKIDALKEIIRAWGLNPEDILTRDALARPNATVIGQNQLEDRQLRELSNALKQQVLKDIREG